MGKWITKAGEEIHYNKLTDSHLLNILRLIEKKAKEGMIIGEGGGSSPDEMWYDERMIKGKEVKRMCDYKGLMKEAKRRGIK